MRGTEEGCARSASQVSQHSFNLKHKTNIECKPSWELWEAKRAYIFFSLCDKEEEFWVRRERTEGWNSSFTVCGQGSGQNVRFWGNSNWRLGKSPKTTSKHNFLAGVWIGDELSVIIY